ncbi:DUF1127 domain-containing protein [Reyranella sp.]|uniref:DUF1127 domain-containing protein n=1 Tax=Reyranella sp. TaxID=1929291 RepID=UPI003BAD15D0
MMTQPIQMFDSLTSESAPAGGNTFKSAIVSYDERRMLELRARYARAEMIANGLGAAIVWLRGLYGRLTAAIGSDFRLRAAESQLYRMSDRELADIGLTRSEIAFAVREHVEGATPAVAADAFSSAANENLRRVA